MWIVRLALRRPYTFVIVALLIGLLGMVTIQRTPTDIFPEVNIPIVSVIWSLNGISVDDMEKRIITVTERGHEAYQLFSARMAPRGSASRTMRAGGHVKQAVPIVRK